MPLRLASRSTLQESAMRIQAHPTAASTLPSAAKSTRSPHAPAMKATPAAATAAKAAASPAKAAAAAASPETYGGAGSLLDAHA